VLTAQTQHILVQAQRQILFPADPIIARLPKGNPNVLQRRTKLLPQLSCTGIGMARFRRSEAFDRLQRRAQGAAKFQFLSLSFGVARQQR
jgi:hypothetical protein